MKRFHTIVLLIIACLGCLIPSLFITWLVWEMQIDGRVFRCTDAGFFSSAFWLSAETHKSAGDKILAGWTWEKLELVNTIYQSAFFVLWLGGTTVAFGILRASANEEMEARVVAKKIGC